MSRELNQEKLISLLTIERPGTEQCSGALSTELKRDCTIYVQVLPSVTFDRNRKF